MERIWIGLYPMITSLKLRNNAPCSVFVKKPASIMSIGQYYIFIFFLFTLSATKKYRILICLELSVQKVLPFFSMRISLGSS